MFQREKEPKKLPEYIKTTSIQGLLVIERPTFDDDRGFFRELVRMNEVEEATGIQFTVRQWNHSLSHQGVIRGLHAEGWNKIVYPVTGRIFIAIVDIRTESETFARVEIFEFDASKEHKAIFISKGLANSICVAGNEDVNYLYLVDAYYDGKDTTAISWDDPDLAIKWPIKDPIISSRDRNNPTMRDL